MWYAGIDLHRPAAVVAMVDDRMNRVRPRTFQCSRPREIVEFISNHRPFKAVIEASCAYRWLHDMLAPHGEVVLAHPLLLKSVWNTRAKTDKKDAEELADLLRSNRIPRAYIPPERYQGLRDLTRERARMVWGRTEAENALHSILWRVNLESPFTSLSGKGALEWLESVELPMHLAPMRDERDERVERVRYFERATARLDADLGRVAEGFPETAALTDRAASAPPPLPGVPASTG
jgi:transposase